MPAPAVAMAAIRIGAFSAVAWKALEEMKDLGQAASDYMVKHSEGKDYGSGHNDAADAFRHAFASAKMTLRYGETAADVMGALHEYHGNFGGQPEKECGMDMWNNKAGRTVASRLPSGASDEQIGNAVMDSLKRGELIVALSDPRTAQGLRELPTVDDLSNRAMAFLKEAKTMVADISPSNIREALASKSLSPPVVEGLAKGGAEAEKNFSPSFTAKLAMASPQPEMSR